MSTSDSVHAHTHSPWPWPCCPVAARIYHNGINAAVQKHYPAMPSRTRYSCLNSCQPLVGCVRDRSPGMDMVPDTARARASALFKQSEDNAQPTRGWHELRHEYLFRTFVGTKMTTSACLHGGMYCPVPTGSLPSLLHCLPRLPRSQFTSKRPVNFFSTPSPPPRSSPFKLSSSSSSSSSPSPPSSLGLSSAGVGKHLLEVSVLMHLLFREHIL